jgi:hypothetical protein
VSKIELENREKIQKAFSAISKKETSKLLKMAGWRMVQQYKILQRHWEDGQSQWTPPTPAYGKWVRKKYGGSGKFEKTGAGRKMLGKKPKSSGDGVILTVSRKDMALKLFLRKMEGEHNVYTFAQAGRFKGLQKKDGSTMSAKAVHKHNKMIQRAYSQAKGRGIKESFEDFSHNAAKKAGLDGAKRVGKNERKITEVQPGDLPQIEAAIMKELEITLQLKGLL